MLVEELLDLERDGTRALVEDGVLRGGEDRESVLSRAPTGTEGQREGKGGRTLGLW